MLNVSGVLLVQTPSQRSSINATFVHQCTGCCTKVTIAISMELLRDGRLRLVYEDGIVRIL